MILKIESTGIKKDTSKQLKTDCLWNLNFILHLIINIKHLDLKSILNRDPGGHF